MWLVEEEDTGRIAPGRQTHERRPVGGGPDSIHPGPPVRSPKPDGHPNSGRPSEHLTDTLERANNLKPVDVVPPPAVVRGFIESGIEGRLVRNNIGRVEIVDRCLQHVAQRRRIRRNRPDGESCSPAAVRVEDR